MDKQYNNHLIWRLKNQLYEIFPLDLNYYVIVQHY